MASSLSLGYYNGSNPNGGWVLRSRGAGGCWNDRTFPMKPVYGMPGRILWVKETVASFLERTAGEQEALDKAMKKLQAGSVDIVQLSKEIPIPSGPKRYIYKADYGSYADDPDADLGPWTPSPCMPREASRFTLEITNVRVEKLQEITSDDAIAEGVQRIPHVGVMRAFGWKDYCGGDGFFDARDSYRSLWSSLHGADSWSANPYVTVTEFKLL